ncbi:hypothetical protein CCS05_13015 (plasmid) [Levilactobacillus brevis]|nr:hypothetical protein CCS05_13015 [Levilactobacillus brevis]
MVNTILKEADLFCPNSVRINFTIYLAKLFLYSLYANDYCPHISSFTFTVLFRQPVDRTKRRCYIKNH